MPCSCHGKKGARENGTVLPTDQCVTCAAKHLSMARAAWGEFTYEMDNRYWAAGHVRLAVEHLKIDHRDLALRLRDLAVTMEEATDESISDVAGKLDAAMENMVLVLKDEKPIVRVRLARLADTMTQDNSVDDSR